MKKLLYAALLGGAVACHSTPVNTAPGMDRTPGAPTARGAVQRFFDAVRAGDLQEMGVAWGTAAGPTRDTIERNELEKREVVLQCYFNHDAFRVTDERQGRNGRRELQIEIRRGSVVRHTSANTVQGPNGRWYVESLDIAAVRDMCASAPKR